jgi:predicted metalloendopeptidase
MKNEPHADEHIRVNGIARLMDDWYRIYDVKEDQKLYVAPERRVKIW